MASHSQDSDFSLGIRESLFFERKNSSAAKYIMIEQINKRSWQIKFQLTGAYAQHVPAGADAPPLIVFTAGSITTAMKERCVLAGGSAAV